MKVKRIAGAAVSLLLTFLLCGCELFTADTAELLRPPALSGDLAPISDAIKESAGGPFTLKYPSAGNFRSAVIQNDIDGDGLFEAFAFYSTQGSDSSVTMHMNIICENNGVWKSAAQQSIVAGGVDRIDFCDLDSDGIQEILVGWEIYGTSKMQLGVYSFKDGRITQRMLEEYTRFTYCDLDSDGVNEVFIINHNPTEQKNFASVYVLNDTGTTQIYHCELDHTAQSVGEPVVSHLSSGRPAVYIDEVKGVGAVTEVVFVEKNSLVNPLINSETNETLATLRPVGITVTDINGDSVPEIPVQEKVPNIAAADSGERLYLTNWCSYNGETLTVQITTMIDSDEGYYYIIPQSKTGQIAVLKDSESGARNIYAYNRETLSAGARLFTLVKTEMTEYEEDKSDRYADFEEITNDGISVYLCQITDEGASLGISVESIRQNFRLID